MLATICDDTWNMLNMQIIILNSKKDGIIQASPMVAINRLKDLPTWLKVATTLENPTQFLTAKSIFYTLHVPKQHVGVCIRLIFLALQSKVSHQLKFNTAISLQESLCKTNRWFGNAELSENKFSAHVSGHRRQTMGCNRKYKMYLAAIFSPVYQQISSWPNAIVIFSVQDCDVDQMD